MPLHVAHVLTELHGQAHVGHAEVHEYQAGLEKGTGWCVSVVGAGGARLGGGGVVSAGFQGVSRWVIQARAWSRNQRMAAVSQASAGKAGKREMSHAPESQNDDRTAAQRGEARGATRACGCRCRSQKVMKKDAIRERCCPVGTLRTPAEAREECRRRRVASGPARAAERSSKPRSCPVNAATSSAASTLRRRVPPILNESHAQMLRAWPGRGRS